MFDSWVFVFWGVVQVFDANLTMGVFVFSLSKRELREAQILHVFSLMRDEKTRCCSSDSGIGSGSGSGCSSGSSVSEQKW